MGLISTFDINDYIPVLEFEEEISSNVIRKDMKSLFSELSLLDEESRNQRISEYNIEVEKALRNKNVSKHALDLGEDVLGLFYPFLGTSKKLLKGVTKMSMNKFPAIQSLSEIVEDKSYAKINEDRHISILSRINRVARLKREFR